jgi:hypothetical protein
MRGGCLRLLDLLLSSTLSSQRTKMLFKVSIVLVGLFAIVVLISAIYAQISYDLMKMDEERDIS